MGLNIVKFGTPLDSRTVELNQFNSIHKEIETAYTIEEKEVYCVNVIECYLAEDYDKDSIIGERTIKTKEYKNEKSAWNYYEKEDI